MSNFQSPEQQLQSILKNISVEGNLTTGDISQILNLFVIVHQPNSFIPKSTPYNIPSSNTIKFVGRADALEQLHQALQQNSQVAITAIEGMGGVGKTELATQYSLLHLILNTYPGGICWLRARDEDIGIQTLRFAEAKLGIKPPEDWELKDKVDFCWSRWREKKEGNVLIVLDDVNDYPKIQSYLPPQLSQFKVLITTRLQLDLPQSFSLDILSESASLELLRQWIGEEKVNQQLVIAKELCLRLGYLPLALNLVGRYVQKREISVAEMLVRLEREGLQHRALDVHEKDRTRTLNIQRGVAAAFELSWEELSKEAKVLGCLLSLFALAPIPWSLVENINIHLDKEELEDAKVELNDLNLIQDKSPYILHQLIRDFFRSKIYFCNLRANNFVQQAFVQGITSFISKEKITDNKKEHTLTLIPHIAESAIVTGFILEQLTPSLSNNNEYEYDFYLYILALKAREISRTFSSVSPLFLIDNHSNYLTIYLQALEVYEKYLGINHHLVIQQYEVFIDICESILFYLNEYHQKPFFVNIFLDVFMINIINKFKRRQSVRKKATSLERMLMETRKRIKQYSNE